MIIIELLSFLTGKVNILPYLATETPEAPKTQGTRLSLLIPPRGGGESADKECNVQMMFEG